MRASACVRCAMMLILFCVWSRMNESVPIAAPEMITPS